MNSCSAPDLERRISKLEVESSVLDTSLKKDIAAVEKQTNLRFDATKTAVDAALAAQKELVSTSFASSEKAIVKAEAAQSAYNARSNEFRAALDDSNKLNMQRIEVMAMFKSYDEKLESFRTTTEKIFDTINQEIKSLRESRSELGGRGAGLQAGWGWAIAAVSLAVTVFTLLRH